MSSEMPNLNDQIKRGKFEEILFWLRKNIHNKAKTMTPKQLLWTISGEAITIDPFIEYLETKFSP